MKLRILIAVAIHRHYAVGVLGNDRAVRVHAERAHEVAVLFRAVDDLRFIQLVRQVGEYLRRQLNANAYVHAVRLRRDVELAADAFHPLGTASANGDHAFIALEGLLRRIDGKAVAAAFHLFHGGTEEEIRFPVQKLKQVLQHDIVLVRAEVPHRSVEQVELVLHAKLFYMRIGRGVEL